PVGGNSGTCSPGWLMLWRLASLAKPLHLSRLGCEPLRCWFIPSPPDEEQYKPVKVLVQFFLRTCLVRLWPLLERSQVVSYKALSETGVLARSYRWNDALLPAANNSWPTPMSIPASSAASCPGWNASSTPSSNDSNAANKPSMPTPMSPAWFPTSRTR